MLVGLIPEAIGDSLSKSRTENYSRQFHESTKSLVFDISESLTGSLSKQIEKAGYEVQIIQANHDTNALFLPARDYKNLTNTVDAFLDLSIIEYGYVKAPWRFETLPEKKYFPRILVLTRLVSKSNSTIFYTNGFANFEPRLGSTNGSISSQFRFSGINEMTLDPQRAIKGFQEATEQVAEKIGKRLVIHNSTVYVYRSARGQSQEYPLAIEIDGEPAPSLMSRHSIAQTLSPGKHTIRIFIRPLTKMAARDMLETFLEIEVVDRTDYFVKTEFGGKLFAMPRIEATLVSESEGKAALSAIAK